MTSTAPTTPQPRFDLGQIVTTPGALAACPPDHFHKCLARHLTGDWGSEEVLTNVDGRFVLPRRPRERTP